MQISEEIKSRLDIVDVIREYVPNLKAVGVNFTALSPFKREKTPSFVVSPAKQIWHCFSSGKGGDVISFVMEMEGITFVEALRVLAPKAGVTLKRENPEITSKRNRLLDILETAAGYYHKTLLESPLAASARDYLAKRGLSEKTIMDWQIGFSPESWDDVINVLKKRGYNDAEIFAAGLSAKKEGRNTFYNRFRGRIMFPICDVNGNCVAFTARVMPEKEKTELMGKYVNSPETMLYSKGRIVFGLDKAKMEIKSENVCIVVEGQMDCISAHQAGFKNIVASSGTAFTADQLKLLKRYSNNISFSFDMDEAGQLASDRGIREAMAAEMNIKVITIPEGKDPDELIRKNPEAWRAAVQGAKHVMQYYFDKIFAAHDIKEAEGKREAARLILPVIGRLQNRIEEDHWLRKLADELGVGETALRETLAAYRAKERSAAPKEESPKEEPARRETREEKLTEGLLALVMRQPLFFPYLSDRLTIDNIFGPANKVFYRNLIIYYNEIIGARVEERPVFDYQEFYHWLEGHSSATEIAAQLKLLNKLVILGDKDFFGLDEIKAKNEIIRLGISLRKSYLDERQKELQRRISDMEKSGDGQEASRLMEELKKLSDESRAIAAEIENI